MGRSSVARIVSVIAVAGAAIGATSRSARAEIFFCSDLKDRGSPLEVAGPENRFHAPCDIALEQSLEIIGTTEDAAIDLTPTAAYEYGLTIELRSHALTLRNVKLRFARGHALGVVGDNDGGEEEKYEDRIVLESVDFTDQMPAVADCDQGEDRFGLTLHRVGEVTLDDVVIAGPSDGPATLQAGVLAVGPSGGSTSEMRWTGGTVRVRCGLGVEGVRRSFLFHGVLVGNHGPCDLRPKGFERVVQTGRPRP